MTAASKYFDRAMASVTCSELLHFHGATSCWESTVWNLTRTIPGCCKYVLPIALVRSDKYRYRTYYYIDNNTIKYCVHTMFTIDSVGVEDPATERPSGAAKRLDIPRVFAGRLDNGWIWVELHVLVLVRIVIIKNQLSNFFVISYTIWMKVAF